MLREASGSGVIEVVGGEVVDDVNAVDSGRWGTLRLFEHSVKRSVDFRRQALVHRVVSAGGEQPAHDDVFLEAAQVVDLVADRGLGQHFGGLLERRRRDEGLGRQPCLGDAKERRLAALRSQARGKDSLVLLFEDVALGLLVGEEVSLADKRTRRSICRTMTSMCLSLILTH